MNIANLKMTFRMMVNNRAVTLINVTGLAIGITICLYIFSYTEFEKRTDAFIPNYEHIYNLTNCDEPYMSKKMVNLVRENIPELSTTTFVTNDWSPQVYLKHNNQSLKIQNMLVADHQFFKVFQYPTKWGDALNGLNGVNQIVITESLSKKIFGDQNPVGQHLRYNSSYLSGIDVEVTAVIAKLPQNSSWNLEAIISIETINQLSWFKSNNEMWGSCNFCSFFRLHPNVSYTDVEPKLAMISKGIDSKGLDLKFSAIPYSKNYFENPNLDFTKHGDKHTLYLVEAIAVLILLLVSINYINLMTAQREKRFRNVGILKSLGSTKQSVIHFFVTESAVNLLFAAAVAAVFTLLMIDAFNNITSARFSIADLFSGVNLLILFAILLVLLVATGIVPGFVFEKTKILLLLKKQSGKRSNNTLRNTLLVVQFVVSIALVTSILFINKQNSYLQSVNIGYDKENVMMITLNDVIHSRINYFNGELKKQSAIKEHTYTGSPIIDINQSWQREMVYDGQKKRIDHNMLHVSPNFFSFFGMKLVEGKGFNENSAKMRHTVFNQTAIKEFGIEDIDKARIAMNSPSKGRIIGVVSDFNYHSLHRPIEPVAFDCGLPSCDYLYLKINAQSAAQFDQLIANLKQIWQEISPNFPLEYQFLDKTWNKLYEKDRQLQLVFSYTTIISLIVSCFGLIGLSIFILEQRVKEIGLRKVNGAKVSELLYMLNFDFMKWIFIAFLIATPVSYYVMQIWLKNFAYKTAISWWLFPIAGILTLSIVLLTISWQSWRAATRNPVEALRYE